MLWQTRLTMFYVAKFLSLNRPKFPQNKGINMIIFTSSHCVLINNIFLCPTVNHFLLNPTQYLTHRICAAIELLLMMPWYLINNKLTKIYLTLNTSLLMQVNFWINCMLFCTYINLSSYTLSTFFNKALWIFLFII